ncbi:LysR family transcriptional regulator [Shewanella decolorationis]|uniref:LysR family transcriptional regulator n=1 Tax=Shewanella decolorationis TaxID=256839 RepID=A0A5B8QX63_9GAMM|nr:LysR substrate-binding domain-containing protein [Shewanella decolorationis]QDZ90629.1 LysR family transcriptional regulator [Shewanella decolorationis]
MIPLALDLNDLFLFTQVVQQRGFTAASTVLGVPKSRISRRIKMLEERLGARLIQRTSRKMSLTDAGEVLYLHCQAMLAEAQAGEAAVRARQSEPSGLVRISVPTAIADAVLAKLVPDFIHHYPKVKLSLQANNQPVDLIEEGIDVALRGVGFEQAPSSLIQVNLCTVQWGLLASPSWLKSKQLLQYPEQLQGDDVLLFEGIKHHSDILRLRHVSGVIQDVRVNPLLRSDNVQTLKLSALSGLGIACLPLYTCSAELTDSKLIHLLPEWRPKEGRLVMLYPERRGLSTAVRALVDFFKMRLPGLIQYQVKPSIG